MDKTTEQELMELANSTARAAAVETDLAEKIAKAKARYDAMTPEQQAAHDKAQRESWARANVATGDPRFD